MRQLAAAIISCGRRTIYSCQHECICITFPAICLLLLQLFYVVTAVLLHRAGFRDAQCQLRVCDPRMSATNSDSSADWCSSHWDGKSEQKSNSGEKTRASILASSLQSPQPTAADAARRATGCQGVHRNCAAMWEPAAGLCKRQQAESTNPQNALKRRRSAVEAEEEEERRALQHLPESESDRAFSRKVSASLHFFWLLSVYPLPLVCNTASCATLPVKAARPDCAL